jgi:aminoglycoside 2'-N-acetyltransferase I
MVEVRVEHTSSLEPATVLAIRQLLVAAFDGDVDEHDVEHAMGGMHAMVWEGPELIGHGSVGPAAPQCFVVSFTSYRWFKYQY